MEPLGVQMEFRGLLTLTRPVLPPRDQLNPLRGQQRKKETKEARGCHIGNYASQLTETKRMQFHQHCPWRLSQQDRLGSPGWVMNRHLLALLLST